MDLAALNKTRMKEMNPTALQTFRTMIIMMMQKMKIGVKIPMLMQSPNEWRSYCLLEQKD